MNRPIEDIQIRLSYSTLQTYNKCPRLFELTRLRNPMINEGYSQTVHTMCGTAAHIGGQSLLKGKALQECWIKMLMAWDFGLWDDKNKKTYENTSLVIEKLANNWDWSRYQVVDIYGKNPDELSFSICLGPERHSFLGRMDLVLWDTIDQCYCVLEFKTTGMMLDDLSPLYYNSEQGLGNSVVLHSIDPKHKSFKVIYVVFQYKSTGIPEVHILEFKKTLKQRLEWLQTLGMRYQNIIDSLERYELFPKNGDSCLSYNRPCQLFKNCDLVLPDVWSPDKPGEQWDFTFNIDTLIDEQIAELVD